MITYRPIISAIGGRVGSLTIAISRVASKLIEKKWWLLLLLLLSILPFKLPSKVLVSRDEIRNYYTGKTGPMPLQSEIKFKIFVPAAKQEHYLVDRLISAFRPSQSSVSIVIGTYQRDNDCELVLWIRGAGKSRTVHCSGLLDNRAATFYFENPVPSGIQEGTLVRKGSDGEEVAIYYYEGSLPDEIWLLPHSPEALVLLFELLTQVPSKPRHGVAYLLCLSVAVITLSVRRKQSISLSMAALYLGMVLISKPYSGFDETAHIDMMHQQFHGSVENRPEFWHRVYKDMLQERFPLLHGGITPRDAECPHQILGDCGRSDMPKRLYSFYFSVIEQLRLDKILDLDSPSTLRALGISFNLFWLLLLLGLTWIMVGSSAMAAMAVILILYGGCLAQFPTITNDIPLIFLGLLIMITITGPLVRRALIWDLLGWLVLLAGFCATVLIDKGSIASIPLILCVPIVIFLARKHHPVAPSSATWLRACYSLIIVILTVLLTIALVRFLIDKNPRDFFTWLTNLKSDFSMLQGIAKFDQLTLAIVYFWQYMKSFFGSFVWGHSYYHSWTYFALFSFFVLLSSYGTAQLVGRGLQRRIILLLLSVLLGVQVIIALSIPATVVGFSELDVIRDSFLKTRLTSPGLAAILNFAFLGLCHLADERNGNRNQWPFFLVKLWVLILLSFYLPKMYVLDAL